ncbi:MAG: restriction endonuclease [Alteromonadaceae bacterium]|jgi:putative restriction endonuclease|uniref:HNH endonuclease n=1 Tax=unclassified Methylophaga TaxID=2629249 RepID=UPI000C4658CC|nr:MULTISPECIES: HNH endonuclease [unclassified Methylophaga]MAP25496.1 restriction endonuclease [Methylophaga sp.]MBN27034.1 restriction endonuclease [Alteromonadaceae bacterium]HBX60849.1 restriction endonuclease [Methylophaga sp.]|tara:strand:+ start:28341 stop:29144 length:804 start_codon:yes stop_codon:yes gene_type:complete
MELSKPQDLFSLVYGATVSKRNLFDLIQYSKVESSPYWSGPELVIGNTPQQGINWIGSLPSVKAVIIKTRPGSYEEDGWSNDEKSAFHYSFKARNGMVNFQEKANDVLIKQPQHLYPILLFTESKDGWHYEGDFSVSEIEEKYVVLIRKDQPLEEGTHDQNEVLYQEGERRYVTHLMAERSKTVVAVAKNASSWICEICSMNFYDKYGVKYIEAHHKTPISTYSAKYVIKPQDLALLCPNCHKAVHIHMKSSCLGYDEIVKILSPNG